MLAWRRAARIVAFPALLASAAFLVSGAALAQTPAACTATDPGPTPTAVAVDAVPIVVQSTAADYFVLYVRHDGDGVEVELPVLVKRGAAGTTTLAENVEALPAERYRVEKYLVVDPADVDGDCVDDITELDDPVGMSPLNAAPSVGFSDGAASMPDLDTYLQVAQVRDGTVDSKITLFDFSSERPGLVFINSNTHQTHRGFLDATGIVQSEILDGFLTYNTRLEAPDGSLGAWYLWVKNHIAFTEMERVYAFVAANLPALRANLYVYIPVYKLDRFEGERQRYEESRMDVVFDEDISRRTGFDSLNTGVG